jgi:uncharacterized protein YjbI with pentapeptide repeats
VSGDVVHVFGRWSLPGLLLGLSSGFPGYTNSALVRVEHVLRGDVGRWVLLTSDLQNGNNGGFSFKEGPIHIGATRSKSGRLVTSFCFRGVFAHRSQQDLWNLADEIVELGDTDSPEDLSEADLKRVDSILARLSDSERRLAMWRALVDSRPDATSYAGLAAASLSARLFEDARNFAQKALDMGASEARPTLETAKIILGEEADSSEVILSSLQVENLDISATNFDLKHINGLASQKTAAAGATFKAATFSDAEVYGGNFDDTDFTEARIINSHFIGQFNNSQFVRASINGGSFSITAGRLDFTDASGTDIFLSGKIGGSKFNGAKFDQIRILRADLSGATFDGAQFENLSFENVTIGHADLSGLKVGKVSWKSVTYDCSTKFPPGFDPLRAGLRNNEACAGQKEPDLSTAKLEACDDFCLRWLTKDEDRTVSIEHYKLRASRPGKGLCSKEALHMLGRFNSPGGYREEFLDQGFCPEFLVQGAARPEDLFSTKRPDNVVRDAQQLALLDRWKLRHIVYPRVENYYVTGGRQRIGILRHTIKAFHDDFDLIERLVIHALTLEGIPKNSDPRVSQEADSMWWLTYQLHQSKELSTHILELIEANPHLAGRFGFQSFLQQYPQAHPFNKREIWCTNVERALKLVDLSDDKTKKSFDQASTTCAGRT